MSFRKNLKVYILNFALLAAAYVLLLLLMQFGVINRYYSGIITMICINIMLAVSLNLSTGFLGQLVLGHAGFMAVGAYCAAIITMKAGLPFPVALLAGGILAAIVGFIIGIPALRMKGDYLAIITLGFGEIIRVVLQALPLTGGGKPLSGVPASTTFTWVFVLAVATVFVCYTFIHSRHGRAVISIREDEIASEASGVNTTFYKMLAFVLAAFLAGIAGGLYGHQIGVLKPTTFDFNYSINILVMVVLGGMGSITGSVIAAVILTILPEALRNFSDYRMLLYSAILIVMMLFRPTGLLGTYELSMTKVLAWIKGKRSGNKPGKGAVSQGGEPR